MKLFYIVYLRETPMLLLLAACAILAPGNKQLNDLDGQNAKLTEGPIFFTWSGVRIWGVPGDFRKGGGSWARKESRSRTLAGKRLVYKS